MIDAWDLCEDAGKEWDTKAGKASTFNHFADKEHATIIQDFSVQASKKFENHYFDWIHLDSSTKYEDIKKDLAHWLPKIKKGGHITGGEFCVSHPHWPGVYSALIEFILKYVEKKPELLEFSLYRQRLRYERYLQNVFCNIPQSLIEAGFDAHPGPEVTISSDGYPLSDFKVSIQFDYIFQVKGCSEMISTVMKWIEYFPTQRHKGGAYALRVGDWVDDLDYDEIIKEANSPQDTSVFHTISQGISPIAIWLANKKEY